MPGFDGTGPRGMGPMTGGGRGWCNPYNYYRNMGYVVFPAIGGRFLGRGIGFGRGFGRGLGIGRGLKILGAGLYGFSGYGYPIPYYGAFQSYPIYPYGW